MIFPRFICTIFFRQFSAKPKLPSISKVPSKYKQRAVQEAQMAVIDYLHTTRSVPYTYAEHISQNARHSLFKIIGKIKFSVPSFSRDFKKFLRYHPINEFEFLLESMGIDYSELGHFLPENKFFFLEDMSVLDSACSFSAFGFPWNKLGKLYKEEPSIFRESPADITSRLCWIKGYGFGSCSVIAICLTYPFLLSRKQEFKVKSMTLLDDLRKVFLDFGLASMVEGTLDAWYDVCTKLRIVYDLICENRNAVDLVCKGKSLFLEYPEEILVHKVEYFNRFCVRKEDVGLLLIQTPDILDLDLEKPVISVLGLLKHFELGETEIKCVIEKYPHVLGRNKMANLPSVMRALDLDEWFFNKIKSGNNRLLFSYCLSDPNEDLNEEFRDGLLKIQVSKTPAHTMSKLEFMHEIGYGENGLTIKVLAHLHGKSDEIRERFGCLLRMGIEYSKLCRMIRVMPKILNQQPEALERKVNFLCNEMGSSLRSLDVFPGFLCFDLENRIKPRYRFHVWLMAKGLCTRNYSIASIIATSEKGFLARLYLIHADAPKYWSEYVASKELSNINVEDTEVVGVLNFHEHLGQYSGK